MARFLDKCMLEHTGYRNGRALYCLHERLRFETDEGEVVDVPAGFETDLASVPRLPLAYLLTGGFGNGSAVVHDWLYLTWRFPRAKADGVFHQALIVEGVAPWRARLMWLAVRLAGWVPYHLTERKQ